MMMTPNQNLNGVNNPKALLKMNMASFDSGLNLQNNIGSRNGSISLNKEGKLK